MTHKRIWSIQTDIAIQTEDTVMGLLRTSLLVVLSFAVMSVQAANFNTQSFSSSENFDGLGKTKKSLETGYKSYGVQTVQKKRWTSREIW